MSEHAKELSEHIKTQDKVIKHLMAENLVLKNRVREQGEMLWEFREKNDGFYSSDSWLELRQRVLDSYGAKCMCCGTTAHDAIIQVDHIKPFSIYPELALEFDNLQVLCSHCNRGKSNRTKRDYRPERKAS